MGWGGPDARMNDVAQLKYSLGTEKKSGFQSPYQTFTGTKVEQLQRGSREDRESFPPWTGGLGTLEEEQ